MQQKTSTQLFLMRFRKIRKHDQHMVAAKQIKHFFETQVKAESGLVEDAIVTEYSDEGHNFDSGRILKLV